MASTTVSQFATELKVPPQSAARAAAGGRRGQGDRDRRAVRGRQVAPAGFAARGARRRDGGEEEDHDDAQADHRDQAGRSAGKARTIQVEVRKKRIFVKRDEGAGRSRRGAGPNRGAGDRRGGTRQARGRGAPAGRVHARQMQEARERAERAQRELGRSAAERGAGVEGAREREAAARRPDGARRTGAA